MDGLKEQKAKHKQKNDNSTTKNLMPIVHQRFLDLEAGVSGDEGSQDSAEYSDHDLSGLLDDSSQPQDDPSLYVPWDALSRSSSPVPPAPPSAVSRSEQPPARPTVGEQLTGNNTRQVWSRPPGAASPPPALSDAAPAGDGARSAGGTKRARLWLFTRNQRDDEDELPPPWVELPRGATWLYFSEEMASRPHYQGVIHFSQAKTLTAVVKLLGAGGVHVLPANGTAQQNRDYCSKEPVRGPWELGEQPHQGRRNDLEAALDAVKKRGYQEAFLEHPLVCVKYSHGMKEYDYLCRKKARAEGPRTIPPKILVLIGPPGSGKSHKAHLSFPPEELFVKDSSNKWWDGYSNESVVLLDDFYGAIPYSTLLTMLDQYPKSRETKGGHVLPLVKQWVITSNKKPWEWYRATINQDALMDRLYSRFESQVIWMEKGCLDAPLALPPKEDLPWNKSVGGSQLPLVLGHEYPDLF